MADQQKDLFGNPVSMDGQKVWTVEALSQEAGVNRSRIRQLCLAGRFPGAFKFGKNWAIPDDAAQVWLRHDRDRRFKHYRKDADSES